MLGRISTLLLLLYLVFYLHLSPAILTDCSSTIIPDNSVIVFNSRTFNEIQLDNTTDSIPIPGWTTFDEDEQSYLVPLASTNITIELVVTTQQGDCSPEYTLCPNTNLFTPIPNAERNWILTSYYVTEANNIELRIQCTSAFSIFIIDCRSAIRAYYYESDEDIMNVSSLIGQFVPTQAFNGTAGDGFVYFTFTKTKSGFVVGFLVTDYCILIDNFLFYYFQCPTVNSTLFSLNAILAPNSTQEPTIVPVNCPIRSQLMSLSFGRCYANGIWDIQTDDLSCECVPGAFLHSTSCSLCPTDSFKQAFGNNAICIPCPANSNTNGSLGALECVCDVDWFRGVGDNVTESCGRSPSAVRNIRIVRPDVGPVVMWDMPSFLGNRGIELLSYRVSYHRTVGSENSSVMYDTTDTQYNFGNTLYSSTEYVVVVTSLNTISNVSHVFNEVSITFVSSFPVLTLSQSDSYLSWKYTLYAVSSYQFQIRYTNVATGNIEVLNVNTSTCRLIGGFTRVCNVSISNFELLSISLLDPSGTISMLYSTTMSLYIYIIAGVCGFLIIVLLILILCCCCIICCCRGRRRYELKNKESELIPLHAQLYQDPSLYDDLNKAVRALAKEINPDEIVKESIIGVGEFGDVWKGYLIRHERKIPVALKILKPASTEKNKDDFFKEASVMGQFSHPNVIFLYGVTLRKPIMIVTPFMQNGSLDKYLITHMNNVPFDQLVTLCYGAARGMVYLSLLGFVHRDLAARNILLDKDLTPKITDFGLSRETEEDFYRVQTGGKIPVRWTAPEAILYRKFNTASDMWSFGILMWEVMSFGQTPYGDTDNFTIMDELQKGYRLPAPDRCPSVIYTLILSCWNKLPEQRPSFTEIQQSLLQIMDTNRSRPTSTVIKSNQQNPLNHATLESWLTSLKLERYAVNFRDKGYSQIASIWHMSEAELFDIGIIPVGHRNKIMSSIHRANTQLCFTYSVPL